MTVLSKWNKVHIVLVALLAFIIMALSPVQAWAATMSATPNTVTEKAGFDQEFTLTLEGDQFLDTVPAEYIDLGGDFESLSVSEVVYQNSTTVTAQVYGDLSYGTGQGTITVLGQALNGVEDATATVTVQEAVYQDQGLVLHLEFEDNLNDSSGMGNDGEVLGNTESVAYTGGVMGRAAFFPGVDEDRWGAKVPASSLQFDEEVTISFYARLDNERGINEYGIAKDKGYHSFFRRDGDTKFVFLLYTNDRHFETFHRGSNMSYALGEWMRITVVVSADRKVVVYKNKQKVMEEQLPQDVNLADSNGKDLFIGAFDTALSWFPLWGAIDDFRIYNRALSEGEVMELVLPSSDANLSDLQVGGVTINNFDPATDTYTVEVPYSSEAGDPAVQVTATATDAEAELTITQATEVPGAATVMVTAEDGTERTYTVNLVLAAPVSADINPDEVIYDLNNPTDDVSTTITWNDARSITEITCGETPLTLDSDYTVQGDTLTVTGSYLAGLGLTEGGSVTLTVSFDVGEAAQLTITVRQDFAGGKGTEEEPYLIADAGQLDRLRNYLGPDFTGYYFQLQGDIDLEGLGWEPVGQYDEMGLLAFSGTFDGNGHVIRNLTIDRPDEGYVGLFGYAEGAVFRNVILENVNVSGNFNVGGLVGRMREGTIEDSSVGGSVNGTSRVGGLAGDIVDGTVSSSHAEVEVTGDSGGFGVGGLVGFNAGGTISGSHATGNVTGNNSVGGLVGIIDEGTISGSYATGNVTGSDYVGGLAGDVLGTISDSYATGTVTGIGDVGGLVGDNYSGTISASCATGDVTGQYCVGGLVGYSWHGIVIGSFVAEDGIVTGDQDVGGLLGFIDGVEISNSYTRTDVIGRDDSSRVGGLVGTVDGGEITNCYAAGAVSGDSTVGGLVGDYWNGTITECYYDSQTTGRSGEDNEWGTPKTTAEMMQQATFNGWDFNAVWGIWEDNTYPYLKWQDRSGFTVATVQPGSKTSGETFNLNITGATGIFGSDLNGGFNVAVTSDREGGEVFNQPVTFTDGTAMVPVILTVLGEHTLTVAVEGVSWHQTLTITVEQAPAIPHLTVRETYPVDSAANVPINPTITVIFSENIEPGTEYADITLVGEGNNTVTVTMSTSGDVLTITPDSNLSYSNEYTVTIPAAAVQSTTTGANLEKAYIFNFATRSRSSSGSAGRSSTKVEIPKAKVLDSDGNISASFAIKLDNSKDTAAVEVDSASLREAYDKSKADDQGVKTIEVKIPEIDEVKAYETILPASALNEEDASGALKINTGIAVVTVPRNMLPVTDTTRAESVCLTIAAADKGKLALGLKSQIGNRPVIDLKLKIDGKTASWSNEDAPVTVSIPYTPTEEELADPEHITVWYIDSKGRVVEVPSGRYDPATGMVTFSTTHFSNYAVVYVTKTFDDLGSVAWAKKQIEVLASKGILKGVSEKEYVPQANITRADFLYFLVRTLGVNAKIDENFDDIKSDAYYYKEIAIAKKLGITNGTGNNKFSPDESITRQDMMVLSERALRMLKKLEVQGTASDLDKFADKSLIADYAINSVASLVKKGLIVGSGGKVNPLGNTTRAEAATFLYRIYNLK